MIGCAESLREWPTVTERLCADVERPLRILLLLLLLLHASRVLVRGAQYEEKGV